ncbi:la-related protein 1C isoform X2 [Tripterygium wilfordii]|uniref:la-related protein 1C isoform X2 n=1 Tax=Tripterygium wilfordii TaxID=458696 RepID=UPI0018F82600|nr:la-related protein 1C isoform X2 [Tripterygium wilfordii]
MSINNNKSTNTSTLTETVNDHSPRHRDTGGSKSPQSRRTGKGVIPPWTQIVRGGESELIAAAPSSPVAVVAEQQGMPATAGSVEETVENGPGPNGNAGKRPAWDKPSNGDFVLVMGADSWPPLSDSARASSKSSSESLKGLDGSSPSLPIPATQKHNGGNGNGSSNGPSPRSGFTHSGNDQPRNSFRNRNGGHHSRGDGSHHHNGGRRDQDRGNFYGRDSQPQRFMQRLRHVPPQQAAPNSNPYIGPPPMRPPFPAPMAFPDFVPPVYFYPPPESLRGMPLVAPIPPMFFPTPDPNIYSKIVQQVNYWFSGDNLAKDIYLRKNMDDQGWVSIELIAGFKKVAELTNNIQLILDALRSSTVVEVQGNKVRRRNDWERWIMPQVQVPSAPSPQSTLIAGVQSISLEDKTSNQADLHPEVFLRRSSSRDVNNQSQEHSGEGKRLLGSLSNLDHSTSARNLNKDDEC